MHIREGPCGHNSHSLIGNLKIDDKTGIAGAAT